MAHVYRFHITFEEDEDISRIIEIKPSQTFQDLHDSILKSVDFKSNEAQSLFLSTDDQWHHNDELIHNKKDNDGLSKKKIVELVEDPHQRFILVFNLQDPWFFHIEMMKIGIEEPKTSYPRCARSDGAAPPQTFIKPIPPENMDEDDFDMDDELDELDAKRIMVDEEAIDESEFDDINDGEKPV